VTEYQASGHRRLIVGSLSAALLFTLFVSGPITLVMGQQVPVAAWVLYWSAAFAIGLISIVPPYFLIRRYVRLPAYYTKLVYLCVVFGLSGSISTLLNEQFRQGGWLAIALFAASSSLVLWYAGQPRAAPSR